MRAIARSLTTDVCITSPPYFQKFDYGMTGQYGLEASVQEYLRVQVAVFHEVQRHLRLGGTCFIVKGDTSNNYSPVRAKSQRKVATSNGGCGDRLSRTTERRRPSMFRFGLLRHCAEMVGYIVLR
jgi:hypothetical protein